MTLFPNIDKIAKTIPSDEEKRRLKHENIPSVKRSERYGLREVEKAPGLVGAVQG